MSRGSLVLRRPDLITLTLPTPPPYPPLIPRGRRKATARAGLAKQQQQEQSPPKLAVGAKGEEEAAAAVPPAVEGGLGEDETLSAAVAGVAAAAEAARIAGYDADAEKGKEQEKKLEDEIASAMQVSAKISVGYTAVAWTAL